MKCQHYLVSMLEDEHGALSSIQMAQAAISTKCLNDTALQKELSEPGNLVGSAPKQPHGLEGRT